MRPLLFNFYITDLDGDLEEKRIEEEAGISGERVWSLTYADDIVLVTNNRETL